jgi:hypothetical protein
MSRPRRTIERRLPSPVQRCALTTTHGAVFKHPDKDMEQDFIPAEEILNFYGSPDAWVAHKMWTAFGGCAGQARGGP